ncbi:MAG: ABC transporter permease [Chloroflexi bacterium]|nr:ABC transporter permease [Chloroflexota bacterium]MYC01530.1 ABC transporter permease [Chloroflexota bacterium]MYD74106.1 ABC transporter permease [Chloroflexota bacterium]
MAQTESQYAPLEQTWLRRKRDESLTVDALYRTVRNPQGAIGAAVFGLLIFVAIFADLLAPHGEAEQIRGARLLAPSGAYWFGTDDLSRDIFSRILFGLRISLYVSVAGVLGGGLVGTIVGFVSGYAGGWLEAILMRIVDTLLAFPFLLLGIAVLAILGTGTSQVALALGIANIPVFARIARAQLLTEKERDYVLAARCLGASPPRIIGRHIATNALPPLLVQAALAMAFAVIAEATLSFLGLGASPPTPTLGIILSDGRRWLFAGNWWFVLFPTLGLSLILLSLNFLADSVVEAIDPHRRHR